LFHHCGVQLSGLEELVCENSHPENLPLTGIDVASHHLNYDSRQDIPTEHEQNYKTFNSKEIRTDQQP
jgi:hypothetical protein